MGERLDNASVQYNDFSGTAAFDGHGGSSEAGLGELAGLDPDEWVVVGFEAGGAEHYSGASVFAIPRSDLDGTTEGIPGLAARHGAVKAMRFEIDEAKVKQWMAGFKRWSIVATFKGVPLEVEDHE